MSDFYDMEVERLTELAMNNPSAIRNEWFKGTGLFQFASKSNYCGQREIGCLTLIRGQSYVAETPELTAAIYSDERLPKSSTDITVEHLPVFAEWQRRLDAELGRTVPA